MTARCCDRVLETWSRAMIAPRGESLLEKCIHTWARRLATLAIAACAAPSPAAPSGGAGGAAPKPVAGAPAAGAAGSSGTAGESAIDPSDAGAIDASRASAIVPAQPTAGALVPGFLSDAGDQQSTLVAVDWQLAAGFEAYLCARVTAPRDVFLHEFFGLMTNGTHHAVLVIDDASTTPDGVSPCAVDRSGRQVFDSNDFTAGANAHMVLPNGVAMPVRAGQQLLFNLHLLNPGSESLVGRSGVVVRTLAEDEVVQLAQTLLAGPRELHIPPGSVTQKARCPWSADATLFAVAPHMHELGSYMTVTAHTQTGDTVLVDGLYSFDWQHIYVTDMLALRAGDEISIECTYQNQTPLTVGFGEGVHDEMCFAALSVFPATPDAALPCSE